MLALRTQDSSEANHLTFADWMSGVLRRWRTVAWAIAVTCVAAVAAVLIIAPKWEAEASFVVNGAGSKGLGAASSGLAGLAGQLGLGGGADASESPAFYKELLTSREFLTRMLTSRFPDPRSASPRDSAQLLDLINVRETEPRRRMELAVKKLKRNLVPETNVKTALVRVFATTRWPLLSAQVGNQAMEMVNHFNLEQRASRARAKRAYLEQRLTESSASLHRAEAQRRGFLMGNRQMDRSPALQLDDDQLKRNIDIAREEYQSLQKEYETARLDEFNDAPLITIVDSAIPPAKAKWPQYPWIVVGCLVVGTLLGVSIAGTAVVWEAWAERNPASARRLAASWDTMKREVRRRRNAVGA